MKPEPPVKPDMIHAQRNQTRFMFDAIARRYDVINRIFSFRRDVAWRKAMLRTVFKDENHVILDIATGTGDVLKGLAAEAGEAAVFGADISFNMLQAAQNKLQHGGRTQAVLMQSDAAALCFADRSVDTITIAFGIRNFALLSESFREIYRVLRPGGKVVILEFSLPENYLIRSAYLFYFRYLMTPVAGKLSRQKDAYRYLNRSVEAFPRPSVIRDHLYNAGFEVVQSRPMTFGVVTLYTASRSE
ncbi:MAG TPA: bifunctional demethylmenaquinone methyltransferase/2-methoxy-6-polyprenyl-1,4-benzoquinol methylase UbiE [Candidatus Hydrogenedentes bacterium]|jgi:demethylmenaquinone methyltransferase/2-methoxy-6-polyprenyl-1,4-benzoquinol methylase|nr:MAG: Demethylmenaquinone methyltransferase [Candidatus Hydrogenedentes bacterium ADurb.Bin170]HOD95090.1 bifunctional demethylmenaquinone methyltransferase/2-methoxy-6-polyprenyl-1,4-benzoquinol methylase UbiE [Candidatus Hydrogenedentota bacterium]HOH42887.1 bifunctional demethylmenaquinone methyltransferase/2-methoxy-6-polyprenyl-1,4-benzoquinol methylase UbiE [Candidatus Hydrogenedentota bacterium]HOR51359.1 bifunctional demethylmenaquinone methyltransferase/2-methoxy-6-polyprenyl-1,4-benz